ncbi:hypothetical protein HanPI659440_Chr09g0332631 [Helianthus annuus]|nr:hypothetical protein HanPI659440_Chr09g0332631 [Helianthus annuus]
MAKYAIPKPILIYTHPCIQLTPFDHIYFGFASFKDVKDRRDLEKLLRGVKMGDHYLKINIARFAVENAGFADQPVVKDQGPSAAGNAEGRSGFNSNFRDFRSYSEVLGRGSSKVGSGGKVGTEGQADGEASKSIVAPDRTDAFSNLHGLAVIGMTANLETLVDFDKLMRIAKIDYVRIQYLGGLTILISFLDKAAANDFLEAKNVWEPWFSKLEGWNGQSLHLERVAWLKMSGIPLHLLELDLLSQIGALFGKVLHVPNGLEEDLDISFCRVGILAGEADRINEVVTIKWKSRLYRIRVEEELDIWNPDCLGVPVRSFSDAPSPMMSSPVIGNASSGSKDSNGPQQECERAGGGGGSVNEEIDSHAMEIPMHEERENDGASGKEVGGRKTVEMEGNPKVVDPVGPGCGPVWASSPGSPRPKVVKRLLLWILGRKKGPGVLSRMLKWGLVSWASHLVLTTVTRFCQSQMRGRLVVLISIPEATSARSMRSAWGLWTPGV